MRYILGLLGWSLLLAGFLATSLPGCAQTAQITLRYDDSRNPSPFSQIFFCSNVNPDSGEYEADWGGFDRRAMFDDGQHGDGASGDRIWGATISVKPVPGQLFEWAADEDQNKDNSWLGPCPPFLVETLDAKVVEGRSMPDEAYMTPAEVSRKYGIDLRQAGPPVRVPGTDLILFTWNAPRAQRVFLAGSFNDWARNDEGRVRDMRATMFPVGNGTWFRLLQTTEDSLSYKYVEYTAEGDFQWKNDPSVSTHDAGGNSMIQLSSLPSAHSATRTPQGSTTGGVNWKPYSRNAFEQVLANEGQVVVYVRMENNPRCREFEKEHLLKESSLEALSGTTVLFLDASDPQLAADVRGMAIHRVPALGWSQDGSAWKRFFYEPENVSIEFPKYLLELKAEVSP